jgi:hypothetical protein
VQAVLGTARGHFPSETLAMLDRSHAARQRRFRERRRAEVMMVSIAVDRHIIDWLCATRWLTPRGECITRGEVADALERMVADSAGQ